MMTRDEIEIEIMILEDKIADFNRQIEKYQLMLDNLEEEEEI